MKLDKQQFHFILAMIVLLGYVPSVLAADYMGPLDIPLLKYLYVGVMATWGSLASLLQKFAKGQDMKTWKLTAATDIVNANLAAMLVFLACEHYKVPVALEAICYTLGGYGGARSMEALYKKFISTGGALVSQATGTTDTHIHAEAIEQRPYVPTGEPITATEPLVVVVAPTNPTGEPK
jgi:hypothetical protein